MPKKRPVASRSRSSALVRAEHGGAPVRLTSAERKVLDDALRLGEDLREELEAKVMSYGRWLLDSVFADDASAAIDEKTKNPVWVELVRRAGGPTLGISRHLLYVSLQLAAHDKRITDQAWRGLDSGRKEILLPLRTDDRLREAAQHVAKFKLTQAKTREYVSETLSEDGRSRQVRLTAPLLAARVRTLRLILDKPAVLRKVGELRNALEPVERERVAVEIDELKDVLARVARTLRGRR